MSFSDDGYDGIRPRTAINVEPQFDGASVRELYSGLAQLSRPERPQIQVADEAADRRAAFIQYFNSGCMDRCLTSGHLFSLDPAGQPFMIIVKPNTRH